MNWSLFKSRHAWIAVALAAGLVLWWGWALRADPLTGELPRNLRLATGWTALLCAAAVGAYGLRKYAHRGRYSPEFLVRTEYEKIAEATRGLQNLAARNSAAGAGDLARLKREANAIVARAGARRVLRANLTHDPDDGLQLRIQPTEPLGRVARWMGAHIWYGLLAGVAVILHAGLISQSVLGLALMALFATVFLSGLAGAFLWSVGPRWMTDAEGDLSIEEADALYQSLNAKRLVAAKALAPVTGGDLAGRRDPTAIAEAARGVAAPDPETDAKLRDLSVLCLQEARVGAELQRLRRVRRRYMGWKLVHLPAVIALCGLIAVHVFTIWSY